jgi:hypothetical protein
MHAGAISERLFSSGPVATHSGRTVPWQYRYHTVVGGHRTRQAPVKPVIMNEDGSTNLHSPLVTILAGLPHAADSLAEPLAGALSTTKPHEIMSL